VANNKEMMCKHLLDAIKVLAKRDIKSSKSDISMTLMSTAILLGISGEKLSVSVQQSADNVMSICAINPVLSAKAIKILRICADSVPLNESKGVWKAINYLRSI
jgi:hypothetical protein